MGKQAIGGEERIERETRNCGKEWELWERIVGKNGMVGNARNCGRVEDCESD